MKPLLLALFLAPVVALPSGCQTRVYDHGKPAVMIASNLKGKMAYSTPTCNWTYDGEMNNAVPTRAAGGIVGIVGSDIVAAAVPGAGVVPTVGRAAVVTLPHFKPADTTTP